MARKVWILLCKIGHEVEPDGVFRTRRAARAAAQTSVNQCRRWMIEEGDKVRRQRLKWQREATNVYTAEAFDRQVGFLIAADSSWIRR
jgi:hypothetical protein